MKNIYQDILDSVLKQEKLLAVLIDPDKMELGELYSFMLKLNASVVTHIFVGGSIVDNDIIEPFVSEIKAHTNLPVVLFPGDINQITGAADAILFLSLISGRNPEYLIDKQVKAISKLRQMQLEVLPTGYILIESGNETTVQLVSKTQPLPKDNVQHIVDTSKAGELLGMKLIYLEAGSGALNPINAEIISMVKDDINIPLIVGGGIRNKRQLVQAYKAGADMVVIGNAFEEDKSFFDELV
ncbi:MAG: geranylgeranylglyceryl/heptaprenylglyceryl phosphate synthase [Bacteroidetes bacterium]|nr:MAG: geranylgeranylglyceryl/heptaprenylglyceryl phosphate synthase [Bacteroidota bacterium]